MKFELVNCSTKRRLSTKNILIFLVIVMQSFQESRGGVMVAPIVITPSVNRQFMPVEILRRIPGAIIQSANASIESFVQTAGVMVPAGLI